MSAETDAAYALLGLKPGATKAQVDRGWRHLAREAHPDTHPHWTDAQRAKAEKRMKRLNAAHDLLEALLRDGAVPGPPPPSPPPPDVPRPRFEPSFIEFGSVGVADNGMTLQLDLCNRVGHIRNVAPLNTSGSFWRLDGGRAGVYPIRASFTVVVDIPASLTPGTYLEVLTMVVEGEELDVPICATVTAPAASRSSPPPRPAWAPAYAGAASAAPAAAFTPGLSASSSRVRRPSPGGSSRSTCSTGLPPPSNQSSRRWPGRYSSSGQVSTPACGDIPRWRRPSA